MTFFKALYETAKWCVLLGFVIFILSAYGFFVFPNNVNTYTGYTVLFLFFLTAVLSAIY